MDIRSTIISLLSATAALAHKANPSDDATHTKIGLKLTNTMREFSEASGYNKTDQYELTANITIKNSSGAKTDLVTNGKNQQVLKHMPYSLDSCIGFCMEDVMSLMSSINAKKACTTVCKDTNAIQQCEKHTIKNSEREYHGKITNKRMYLLTRREFERYDDCLKQSIQTYYKKINMNMPVDSNKTA